MNDSQRVSPAVISTQQDFDPSSNSPPTSGPVVSVVQSVLWLSKLDWVDSKHTRLKKFFGGTGVRFLKSTLAYPISANQPHKDANLPRRARWVTQDDIDSSPLNEP